MKDGELKIMIDSKILRSEDCSCFYDENNKTMYVGLNTWQYVSPEAKNDFLFSEYLQKFIHILNHELLHHILNIRFDSDTSLRLDNLPLFATCISQPFSESEGSSWFCEDYEKELE